MTITDWIQAISMVVLVGVTVIYAWRTHVISKATKEQADTSAKMVEEMRVQRIMSAQPIIIQKAVYKEDIYEDNNKNTFSHFEIFNAGNSPAIELEITLREKNRGHTMRQTFLRVDDPPVKFRPDRISYLEENKTYYLISEYQSIFSRGPHKTLYQTRLPFKIIKTDKGKKHLVSGELEFDPIPEKDSIDAYGRWRKPK